MPDPTYLSDVIQPAWQALTGEQRTAWHFWAQAHPLLDAHSRLTTLYGQQAHYNRNATLGLLDTPPLLTDPPATLDPPPQLLIRPQQWPITARLADDTTARGGFAYVDLLAPVPSETVAVVTQSYIRAKRPGKRPPRIRHVNTLTTGRTATIDLRDPDGYFATTAGDNRFATIKGRTARRRPDCPLGSLKITSTVTGQTIRQAIPNPTGGAATGNNRARATQVNPHPGDHFP